MAGSRSLFHETNIWVRSAIFRACPLKKVFCKTCRTNVYEANENPWTAQNTFKIFASAKKPSRRNSPPFQWIMLGGWKSDRILDCVMFDTTAIFLRVRVEQWVYDGDLNITRSHFLMKVKHLLKKSEAGQAVKKRETGTSSTCTWVVFPFGQSERK